MEDGEGMPRRVICARRPRSTRCFIWTTRSTAPDGSRRPRLGGGAAFTWTDGEGNPFAGTTAWLIAPEQSDPFAPSTAPFMVDSRVEDLHALLTALREEGCKVLDKIDESEYGKFGWVIDPEGSKVELWQPPAGE